MARQNYGPRTWLEYQALGALRASLARLPLARAVRVGAAIGSLAFSLDRISRPVAMQSANGGGGST